MHNYYAHYLLFTFSVSLFMSVYWFNQDKLLFFVNLLFYAAQIYSYNKDYKGLNIILLNVNLFISKI